MALAPSSTWDKLGDRIGWSVLAATAGAALYLAFTHEAKVNALQMNVAQLQRVIQLSHDANRRVEQLQAAQQQQQQQPQPQLPPQFAAARGMAAPGAADGGVSVFDRAPRFDGPDLAAAITKPSASSVASLGAAKR